MADLAVWKVAVAAEVDSITTDADSREAAPPVTVVSLVVAMVVVAVKCTPPDAHLHGTGRPHVVETTLVIVPQLPSNATATPDRPTTVSVATTTTVVTEHDEKNRCDLATHKSVLSIIYLQELPFEWPIDRQVRARACLFH